MTEHSAQHILRQVFGYHAFRGHQAAIIDHVTDGGDALVVMPTGGGKSLCYQIPALLRPGLGVVVSPLIALMQDQVDALLAMGVRAAFHNSTLSWPQRRELEQQIRAGALDLLYVAPERLVTLEFTDLLRACPCALFAIDEAHCVSQWGHDFRPEYRALHLLAEHFPHVPRIALTATADPRTRQDIAERLHLQHAPLFLSSFDRPNIFYRVTPKQQPRHQLLRFIQREHPDDAGIVYCLSRKRVEQTAVWLTQQGHRALPYHAGLEAAVRAAHQTQFLRDDGLIMVATIAFGMGIDKPNVRFVAHLDLPKNLEAYYQETGRAGRDGLPANAWMVYGLQDVVLLRQLMEASAADATHKQSEQRKLTAMLGFCESTQCRRQQVLTYFGESHAGGCGRCDNCTDPPATWDGTQAAQMALSCVYRTGQRFGAAYVIDVLVGADTPRIKALHHEQLSTFGIGKHLSAMEWNTIFRQLIAAGLLRVDHEKFGGLQLTAESRPVLRGERSIAFRHDPTPAPRRGKLSPPTASPTAITLHTPEEQDLWQRLRTLRKTLADTHGVPPYVIFHDRTLKEMIRHRPRDLQAMGFISGIGEHKLQKYGATFLAALQET
ncbi:MAG: DNA helicase RecQ [Deltaproteobacteria bacterium]|nr:DNA helicase RecQ [Deltaproteobacteria bacterium]